MAGEEDDVIFSPDQECRLILIGKTGSGKSSTGNSILGRQAFETQTGMISETKQCTKGTVLQKGVLISVMDTPGLSDTDGEDNLIAERITQVLLAARPGPHAILLVLRGDCRFTDEEVQVYKTLKEIFGQKMTGYLIVIFVGKDCLTSGPNFERQLEKSHKLKKILREANNRFILFNNKAESEERDEQVDKLLELVKKVMRMNQRSCFRFRMEEELNNTMKAMVMEEIKHLTGIQLKIKQWEALEADNKENASVPVDRREIKNLEKRHEVRSGQVMFEQRANNVGKDAQKAEQSTQVFIKLEPMKEPGVPMRADHAIKLFELEPDAQNSQTRRNDLEIPLPLPPKKVARLPTPCTNTQHRDAKSLGDFIHEQILKERLLKLIENGNPEDGQGLSSLFLVEDLVMKKILKKNSQLTSVQRRLLEDAEMVVDTEVKMGMKRQGVKNMAKCLLM